METNEILDTSVAIERGEGTITIFTVIKYPPAVDKFFDIIFPETIDYVKAIEIANMLRVKGMLVGAVDIMIAAMCINRSAKITTKDADFDKIQKACPELDVEKL